MKRLIETSLVEWKNKKRRKPLVIRGARQVGKTFCIEKFGKKHFDNFVKIDFELERSLHKIFAGDLHVAYLIMQIEAVSGKRIKPGKTLLFFDEIQECARALISLRYFYEQLPELHIIAAGSLLEFAVDEVSFPVGRIQFEWMRPMGFEEFLWAMDNEILAENLPDYNSNEMVPQLIHEKLIAQLRLYFLVGGMPEAVLAFSETSSIEEVKEVHKTLTQSYIQDFVKYRKRLDIDAVHHIFEQIPRNTGRRIKYTSLYPEKRVEKIKESIKLFELALLMQKVRSCSGQGLPLGAGASPKIFKIIFLDIGLMQHLCGIPQFDIFQNVNLLDIYKGALSEQFVGQELLLHGGSENEKLFYWDRQNKSSTAEVDYLIVRNGEIYPVEVKSGSTARLKSMFLFLKEHPDCKQGIVMNMGNINLDHRNNLKFIPLYTKIHRII